MHFDRRLAAFCTLILSNSGCLVFDDKLYKQLEPTDEAPDASDNDPNDLDAGTDTGMTAGDGDGDGDENPGGDAGPGGDGDGDGDGDVVDAGPPHLVDECNPDDAYLLTGTLVQFEASTVGFTDNVTNTSCFDYDLPGPEGWIAVKMVAGEKWHFHINPENRINQGQMRQNPAVYMRSNCTDDRGCNPGTYLDLCGDQGDEHFTFAATSNSTWYLAVDDRNGAEGTYLITAYRPVDLCGNNMLDHNETCDDGNQNPGDGCSRDCRAELRSQDLVGPEVNDDWTTANLLSVIGTSAAATTQTVKGVIGGACDLDMYGFQVPANGKVEVIVNKQNGDPCLDVLEAQSSVKLALVKGDGQTVLGEGSVHVDNASTCPTIEFTDAFAHDREEGLYYLRVTGDESKDAFGYQLTVTATTN